MSGDSYDQFLKPLTYSFPICCKPQALEDLASELSERKKMIHHRWSHGCLQDGKAANWLKRLDIEHRHSIRYSQLVAGARARMWLEENNLDIKICDERSYTRQLELPLIGPAIDLGTEKLRLKAAESS